MRVLCFIDSLGSGGAQGQLCTLAVLLRQRGCEVSVATYSTGDFFLPRLERGGVRHLRLAASTPGRRIAAFRREIGRFRPDVVLAFLEGPSLYAEIASLGPRSWGLVVSERSAIPGSHRSWRRWLRACHLAADYVTTNSHTNRLMIEGSVPSLRGRVVTIYNAVDLDRFRPQPYDESRDTRGLCIGVAASVGVTKNPARFVRAVGEARTLRPHANLSVLWCGHQPSRTDADGNTHEWESVRQIISEADLSRSVRFEPAREDVVSLYRWADVVALPSLYEGLPNTVSEAMACSRPILASNVADAGNLVIDSYNGYTFDPLIEESITAALVRMADSSCDVRAEYGRRSRAMAETMFCPKAVTDRYFAVLEAASTRRRVHIEHWVSQVPSSSLRGLR
jgi:glycosyltransferase involved in cell wall biosynthesis